MLVYFDGMDLAEENAECWVDEEGDDEWAWESKFKQGRGVRVHKQELPVADCNMYFVSNDPDVLAAQRDDADGAASAAEAAVTATPQVALEASTIGEWVRLSALRPHWVWAGVDDGWTTGVLLADSLPKAPASGADLYESDGSADEEDGGAAEPPPRTADGGGTAVGGPATGAGGGEEDGGTRTTGGGSRAAASAAGAGRKEGREDDDYIDEGEEGEADAQAALSEEEEEEEEEEQAIEVRGWSKLAESPPLPSGRVLRPYQLEGLNWLRLNWYLGRNVILGGGGGGEGEGEA